MPQASQLLGAIAVVGLLGTQAAIAQDEVLEIAVPEVAPIAPPVATPPPVVIEPVQPSTIVPSSVNVEPPAVDHGAVFIEPVEQQQPAPTLESLRGEQAASAMPEVEIISPTDYASPQIDSTDYSVGATMP
ncbi:MAG: hypothetical protein AAFY17_10010, partial [Cyanobacteria bacterium J06642_11]